MTLGKDLPGLNAPVLFLIFNRPETTARVFAAIRQARPRRLFIASDGPRPGVETDAAHSQAARKVARAVDWDCEVKTLFRKRNLGCRVAVSSAITWFFQQVEEGIILEDDTLPVPGFFNFCQSLLEKYRNDPRVMHISGSNFQLGERHGDGSYYFSRFNHIWGWATWRRAWALYDPSPRAVNRFRHTGTLERLFQHQAERDMWLDMFEKTANGTIDTWDYPWTMALWTHGGLAALPNVNLVANIGFGLDSTHTSATSRISLLPVHEAEPLHHPGVVTANVAADTFSQTYIYNRRIEDALLLAADVATLIERQQPRDASILAQRFLTLHPEDLTLQWLELLALAKAGETARACQLLERFLARHPEHEGGRSLLASIRQSQRAKPSRA